MTGPEPDLAAFYAARLDEDEHWAHMAEAGWPPENALAASEDPEHYAFMATDITPSKATFIRRHDPGRVLREVEADRKLLDEYQAEIARGPASKRETSIARHEGILDSYRAVLRIRAAVFSDHPDYRQEWKPWPSNATAATRQR